MSKRKISESLRLSTVEKFKSRCAYCQTQQKISGIRLTIDHIIPESLGGMTEQSNLCLACWDCNLYKATKVAVYDDITQKVVYLFNPQKQVWSDHFAWSLDSTLILDKTATGRISIEALRLNRVGLVLSRQFWTTVGWHPPD